MRACVARPRAVVVLRRSTAGEFPFCPARVGRLARAPCRPIDACARFEPTSNLFPLSPLSTVSNSTRNEFRKTSSYFKILVRLTKINSNAYKDEAAKTSTALKHRCKHCLYIILAEKFMNRAGLVCFSLRPRLSRNLLHG